MTTPDSLKYYVYVSRSKVEMLYQQIPQKMLSQIEKEVELKLTVVNMKFSEKQQDNNLYSQLLTVTSFLEKDMKIGEVTSPKEYFRGSLFLQWTEIYQGVVFFGGKLNNSVIGLGGSMKHVLGYESVGVERGISHTPWLVSLLSKEIETIINPDIAKLSEDETERRILHTTLDWVEKLSQRAFQRFDFVAKTLKYSTYQNHSVILGTPLYVVAK